MDASPLNDGEGSRPSPPADQVRELSDLPCVKGWPIVGSSFALQPDRLHQQMEAWFRQMGGTYRLRVGNMNFVVMAQYEPIRQILQARPEGFRRSPKIADVFDELGVHGIFTAEGEEWRKQRRLITQAFGTTALGTFFPRLVDVTERLRLYLLRTSGANVEILRDFERFTVDVTSLLAFGHDVNTLEGGRDVLQKDLELVFPALSRRLAAPFPYWRWLPLPRERAVKAAVVRVKKEMTRWIALANERLANDPQRRAQPTTLLEALLVAQQADDEQRRFGEREVLGNVVTLLLAGEDTTAHTLAWMVHALATMPEVQAKAREEADRVLGEARQVQRFDDLRKLSYIDAIAQETLRVRSTAPLLTLQPLQEKIIDNVRLPADTILFVLTRQAACAAENFSDADRFLPQRWLRDDAQAAASCPVHQAKTNLAFGAGPRICPGRGLALVEITTVIAMLVRNFEIEALPLAQPVREHFSFTMRPDNLAVMLRPR